MSGEVKSDQRKWSVRCLNIKSMAFDIPNGTARINVVKTDLKKIVGKKHVKKRRPQPDNSFGFGFFDEEDMSESDSFLYDSSW